VKKISAKFLYSIFKFYSTRLLASRKRVK